MEKSRNTDAVGRNTDVVDYSLNTRFSNRNSTKTNTQSAELQYGGGDGDMPTTDHLESRVSNLEGTVSDHLKFGMGAVALILVSYAAGFIYLNDNIITNRDKISGNTAILSKIDERTSIEFKNYDRRFDELNTKLDRLIDKKPSPQ